MPRYSTYDAVLQAAAAGEADDLAHLWLGGSDGPDVRQMQRLARQERQQAGSTSQRSFIGNPSMIKSFFERLDDPAAAMAGSYCFPYKPPWVFSANVDGYSMQTERDYWLRDPIGGFVVVHVHFGGTWNEPNFEEVTAVNIRHAEGHPHAGNV